MDDPRDEMLDKQVRGYLSAELEGQLGRSERRFRAETNVRRHIAWAQWTMGTVGMAAAAAVALVYLAWPQHRADRVRSIVVATPATSPVETDVKPGTEPVKQQVMQQVTWYRTLDDGVVGLDRGGTPVRRIRRQILNEVDTYDQATHKITRDVRPQEEDVTLVLDAPF